MVEAKPFLKFCPFCNENMSIMASWVGNDPDSLEELEAPVCPCGAQGPMYATREQAIAAWNTRPLEDALRAENERLRGGWLPIESAPSDETLCLFFAPANPKAIHRRARNPAMRTDRRHAEYSGRGYAHEMPEAPYSHWMPLPPPPEPLKGGDA